LPNAWYFSFDCDDFEDSLPACFLFLLNAHRAEGELASPFTEQKTFSSQREKVTSQVKEMIYKRELKQ